MEASVRVIADLIRNPVRQGCMEAPVRVIADLIRNPVHQGCMEAPGLKSVAGS